VLALISIAVMNSSTDLSAFPGLALTSLVNPFAGHSSCARYLLLLTISLHLLAPTH
jgi:hypothetical protein